MSQINEKWFVEKNIIDGESVLSRKEIRPLAVKPDDANLAAFVAEEARSGISRRVPWRRWLSAGILLLLFIVFSGRAAENPAFDWALVGHYLFDRQIMQGLLTTLWLTALVTLLSLVFGVVIAVMRLSANPVIALLAWSYIWLFRATPLLVQLLFWFNIGYLIPRITLGWPGITPAITWSTNDLISALGASILGLTLHGMAYSAEFIRGGLLAIPHGQKEAAKMLGLTPHQVFMKITMPQSLRTIIPALGNFLIDNLKGTSIISVVAVTELLYSAQLIYNKNYKIIPLLLVATIWYVVLTSLLSLAQYWTEKYYSRGYQHRTKN